MVTRMDKATGAARPGSAPRAPRRRAARADTTALLAPLLLTPLLLAVLLAVLLLGARPAAAQDGTLYFVTIKKGVSDASRSGETIFSNFAQSAHGPLQGEHKLNTRGVELDIYSVSRSSAGLGIGMEVVEYNQSFYLQDGEKVTLDAKGVLFSLKTFLRLGPVFPFVGVGLGNYYVNYSQAAAAISFRDSPDSVYNARVGVRILLGRLGLLLEAGDTRAKLPIQTDVGRATLELGGSYQNVGLSWVF